MFAAVKEGQAVNEYFVCIIIWSISKIVYSQQLMRVDCIFSVLELKTDRMCKKLGNINYQLCYL